MNHSIHKITPERYHIRQISNAESVQSSSSESPSKPSPVSINHQEKLNNNSPPHEQEHQQPDEKVFYRTSSVTSSRRSSDRFPPPPQNLETFDSTNNGHVQHRPTSSVSHRSSINEDAHTYEVSLMLKTNFLSLISLLIFRQKRFELNVLVQM